MRNFRLIIVSLVHLSLLASCDDAIWDTTSISSLEGIKGLDAAVAATPTPSESRLPPAYVITPLPVLQSDKYSEGVVVDREGNVYFSQTKAGTITLLKPNGESQVWAQVPGANGHKILSDGTHIVAAQNSVVQLDANGKLIKVVADSYEGKPLVYPNDITIDREARGLYFTDSGNPDPQTPNGKVYYVDSKGKINSVITGVAFANGIILSPDGRRLLVSESNRNRILEYEVLSPGKVGSQKVFAELPVKQKGQIDNKPDGLAMDNIGNLYVAHYGMRQVQVLSPEGKLLRRYSSGNLTTSNLAFAGPKYDQLLVTGGMETEQGSGRIYRLALGIPGLDIRPPLGQR
jgi:gluconolactonase